MFEKIWNWLKNIFGLDNDKEQTESVTEVQPIEPKTDPHLLKNFLSCPIIHFPSSASNPAVGIVSAVVFDDQGKGILKFFDHISKVEMEVKENYQLFSNTDLKQAVEKNQQEGLYTFDEIYEILEKSGFYNTANYYFKTLDSRNS